MDLLISQKRIDLASKVALILEQKFFFNKNVYGKQLLNDEEKVVYNTIYNKIDANIIRHMLNNKQAIMSYQQKVDKLKWLCLDFDIKSSFLDKEYDFISDDKYKPMLQQEVNNTIAKLKELGINYTLEYSGNRGMHIWIFLDKEISKQLGDTILKEIINQIRLIHVMDTTSPITIDKYPKNGKPKSNKIGLGVKIPLSFHLKSNAYSYIVNDLSEITEVKNLTEDIIEDQIQKLSNITANSVEDILKVLNITTISESKEFDRKIGIVNVEHELEKIKNMLSKSEIYKFIFSKELSQLSELDRAILTGTLIRLKTNNNPDYGKELLIRYFSQDKEIYNSEITNKKLLLLENFYPPSIEYLQEKYNMECEYCKKNKINNVLELLEDITISDVSDGNYLMNWMVDAEKKYLQQNDEVPLNFIKDQLTGLKRKNLNEDIEKIKNGHYPKTTFYKYIRKEEKKDRTLYSLGAKDRVLTTYIMFEINKILYGEYASSSSYSYRLNYNTKKKDIFINWNSLWLQYVKDIEDKILNDAYDDYYILKLDIKSFYEQINQVFLRELLYTRPTNLIKVVLNNLAEEDRIIYKNMCEYLLNVAKTIDKNGVPQGPAFARYLAEIYIASLDKLILDFINDDFEHYFRYVDDMVIILENKTKSDKLLDLISNHLKKYDLELNDKQIEGKVRDLKYDIVNKDLEKYFIDGIDEANTPKRVINKATKLLNKMFRNETYEINIKQMPFFLTHLINEDYLKSVLQEVVQEISINDIGRGSLFKHFYKNLVFKYTEEINIDFYKNLKGLSRANFINELSNNVHKIPLNLVKDILLFFSAQDLNDYELYELFRIVLKTGLKLNRSFSGDDLEVIMLLIENTKEIVWSDELLEQILIFLQQKDNKIRVIMDLDNVLSNSKSINKYKYLVETIYATLIENHKTVFKDEKKQIIYNLICFISMFLDEGKIKGVWTNFKEEFNITNPSAPQLTYHDWYKYKQIIKKEEIVGSSIITILTRVFKKEGIIPELGVSSDEENFAIYLFLFLFDSDDFRDKEEMREKVKEITKSRNLKFLEWCLEENVSYFPRDDIAIKNIHLNNRVIMKNGDYLLVRGLPQIFEDYEENSAEIEQWFDDNEYKFIPFKLTDKLMNLEDKLEGMEYFNALDFIVELESQSIASNGYINVFERGTFIEGNKDIHHKYSKYDNSLVISDKKDVKNDKHNFINQLIDTFVNASVKPKIYPLGYVYKASDFYNDFVPKSIDTIEKTFEYLKILSTNIKRYTAEETDTLYTVEWAKVVSIYEFIKRVESKYQDDRVIVQTNRFNKIIKTMHYYNSLYSKDKDFEKFLLYSTIKIKEDNLENIITSLKKSINNNIEIDGIRILGGFFNKEVAKISKISNGKDLSLFELCEVEENLTDKSKIRINNNNINIQDLNIYEIGTIEGARPLTSKDLFRLSDFYHIYFHENFLIVLPLTLSKVIEIIKNKEGKYDKSKFCAGISLVNTPHYTEAIEKIMVQNDISNKEAELRLNSFLIDKEQKYYEPVLKVLSSYKVFENTEIEDFKNEIIRLVKEKETYLIPLKDNVDENGLHQILFHKYQDLFDRNTENKRRLGEDYKSLDEIIKIDKLVIVSDIGLSGSQFINALSSYTGISNKKISKGLKVSNKTNFKNNLINADKIIILNCVYTDRFKEKVTDFIKNRLDYNGVIEFLGKEIKYENYLFSNHRPRDKELFLEFVMKYYKNEDFNFFWKEGYFRYLELIEENHPRNALVARYKSLPKLHHSVFSFTSVLKYRQD